MSDPVRALAGAGDDAWLVGGAVRDRLLARATADYDAVVAGDAAAAAREVARGADGHAFELSEAFGAWRVVARDRSWQLDLIGLGGQSLEHDLARRDLTVNAIAEPLRDGGGPGRYVDPFGGVADLRAGRLRMVGPRAFADDPLRVLRLARLACELEFAVEPGTLAAARDAAGGLDGVASERVFAELRRIVCSVAAIRGLELLDALAATPVVLPELAALHGIDQSRFHHLDVLGHTRLVLAETIALTDDPSRLCPSPEAAAQLDALMRRPLADELTRGQALRFGALLHDVAKPQTRDVTPEGRVTFMDHDRAGAELGGAILRRLRASDRLAAHVAALTRHHLRLGFLVHRMPLGRRDVYDYLNVCAPVGVDVTVLSVADRLATRGDDSDRAIARHLELAREMIVAAIAWEADPPRPPVRGDELARALGIAPGPQLGRLLAELQAERYTGEVAGRAAAIERARELIAPAADR